MAIKEYDLQTMEGRLAYAIDSKGQVNVAKAIGISPTQVYRITKGSKTTLENAIKIAQFTGFNMQWLAFGEGPQQTIESAGIDEEKFALIPDFNSPTEIVTPFSRDYLSEVLKVDPEHCVTWTVASDSPQGSFKPGDIVLVHQKSKSGNGHYVISIAKSEFIISVQHMLDGSVKTSRSDSGVELVEELTLEQFENLNIVGKIIWSSRKNH